MERRTVRFWTMHPETKDWVRVSLRDGDAITVGGNRRKTDEGWTLSGVTFTRDGDSITAIHFHDGVDCDGRLSGGFSLTWAAGGNLRRCAIDDAPLQPDWQDCDSWRYDETAEAAGY